MWKRINLVLKQSSIRKKTETLLLESPQEAQAALTNFMNETPEITLKEIKLQLEEAKNLIGKKVNFPSGINLVDKVTLIVDGSCSSNCHDFFQKNGYVIRVHGGALCIPYAADLKPVKTVSVTAHDGQTYTAESDFDFWKFGCAKISKSLIKEAFALFEKTHAGNRSVEKIAIGKCDFTRETLKALVELES